MLHDVPSVATHKELPSRATQTGVATAAPSCLNVASDKYRDVDIRSTSVGAMSKSLAAARSIDYGPLAPGHVG